MVAEQSEFFASRTDQIRTIGLAYQPSLPPAAAEQTIKVIVSN
jgi:hypothetical protein